jgi:hypothetical protein
MAGSKRSRYTQIAVLVTVLLAPGFIVMLFAGGILLAQLMYWYDAGRWVGVPATELFYRTATYPEAIESTIPRLFAGSDFAHWLAAPRSALGPHKFIARIIDSVGLTPVLLLLAFAYFILVIYVQARVERALQLWE